MLCVYLAGFDTHQRLCRSWSPEENATHYEYDLAGNLIRTADGDQTNIAGACNASGIALAQKTVRSYDPMNRLTSIAYPDGINDATYGYFADGALQSLASDGSTWTYQYNRRRMLTQEKLNFYSDYTHHYSYNANGALASVNNNLLTVDYAPNALGQPTQAGAYATGAQYFPNGAIKQFSYGNGIVHTLAQNARQLPDLSKDAYGGNRVFEVDLDFDQTGNVVSANDLADTSRNRSIGYDTLDRLTSTSAPGLWGTASYTYDVLDNLRTSSLGATSYSYAYDAANRSSSITKSGSSPWAYTLDARGNVLTDGRNTYTFTRANRLAGVAGKETYQYDGHGRRVVVWRQDGSAMVPVYTMNGRLAMVADNAKNGTTSHIYLGKSPVAEVFQNWSSGTFTTTYIHTDILGSPIASTDAARNVIDRNEYAPYGIPVNSTVDGVGFTGHVMDQSTGLIYMQQRYYDPVVGRFLSVDPIATDTQNGWNFNRYNYAANNPYRFTDPDGRRIVYAGTKEEKRESRSLVRDIKRSGPEGRAFVRALQKDPQDVSVSQGTSATKADGTVVPLSSIGGGITIPASESVSGKIEVVFDKNDLVTYTATDGTSATETPAGLVLHELGHGLLLMRGDPSQDTPGPAAEQAVRDLTNPIREEMEQKPEL